ncbi:MAG: hypothetical protein IT360_10175 [Gemmatimonadaceae bacterium]|nr:hypothetical protein [Gemmatimonadaceae bacterium]
MPAAKHTGPLPHIPAKITIPTFATKSKQVGQTEIHSSLSFYYTGISSLWLWYHADLEMLRAYLDPLGMTPYSFGRKTGAVNINFFNAAAMYGQGQPGNQGIGGFNETEINIVGFATKVAQHVPQGLSLRHFLTTGDVTKRLGNYRVWVACDDPIAVAAGRQVFMENKFLTPYTYNVPGLNNPRPSPDEFTSEWKCHDPDKTTHLIYHATVNLGGLSPVPGNMSEVIDLSFDAKTKRPVASRRNYFGMYDTYLQRGVGRAVTLGYGASKHPMRHDMIRLIGDAKPVAIQRFQSPPCIAEVAGYYADV